MMKLPQLDYRIPRWNPFPTGERRCPFCNQAGTALLVRPDGMPVAQCGNCRCFYVALQVEADALEEFYSSYWEKTCPRPLTDEMAKYLLASAKGRAMEDYVLLRLEALIRSFPGRKVLDVGCGFGEKATALASLGAKVIGLDVSEDAVAFCNTRLGIDCERQTLEEYRREGSDFDLVTMFEFIEHPLKPLETLRTAVTKLKPGGLLALTTPNGTAGCRWQPGEQSEWIGFRVDLEHMQYLHVSTVDMLAHELGMTVIHLEQYGFREIDDLRIPPSANPLNARMRSTLKTLPGVRRAVYGLHELRRRLSGWAQPPFGGGDYHLFCVLQKNG